MVRRPRTFANGLLILVDSSVWVDYFNGKPTLETDHLDGLLSVEPVAVGDLILTEVLQGFRSDAGYRMARDLLSGLTIFEMLGEQQAVRAAQHYRSLRKRGITVRKTSDIIIGSFCIETGIPLLFADRDFVVMVDHLNLRSALG